MDIERRQVLGDRRDWDELDRLEAMGQKPVDLKQLLEQWLKENNAIVYPVVVSPLGEELRVENWTPAGWRVGVKIAEQGYN